MDEIDTTISTMTDADILEVFRLAGLETDAERDEYLKRIEAQAKQDDLLVVVAANSTSID